MGSGRNLGAAGAAGRGAALLPAFLIQAGAAELPGAASQSLWAGAASRHPDPGELNRELDRKVSTRALELASLLSSLSAAGF